MDQAARSTGLFLWTGTHVSPLLLLDLKPVDVRFLACAAAAPPPSARSRRRSRRRLCFHRRRCRSSPSPPEAAAEPATSSPAEDSARCCSPSPFSLLSTAGRPSRRRPFSTFAHTQAPSLLPWLPITLNAGRRASFRATAEAGRPLAAACHRTPTFMAAAPSRHTAAGPLPPVFAASLRSEAAGSAIATVPPPLSVPPLPPPSHAGEATVAAPTENRRPPPRLLSAALSSPALLLPSMAADQPLTPPTSSSLL